MPFTQNLAPTFVKQPRRGLAQIANADGSSQKTVVTAGGNGSKVLSLYATSTDTSARDVQIAIVRSATTYILGTVSVPANSGNTNSAPTVDLLQTLASSPQLPAGMLPIDNDGQHFLFVESGDTLVVLALTTVTSGKIVSVHSDYGDL